MHGQGQAFLFWPVKDYIYIYIYVKHLPRNRPTINYGEVLGFTAYKKLEFREGKNYRRSDVMFCSHLETSILRQLLRMYR